MEYNELVDRWSYYLDLLPQGTDDSAYEELKRLIFETYHFCKDILSDKQVIPREKLVLYRCIVRMHVDELWSSLR